MSRMQSDGDKLQKGLVRMAGLEDAKSVLEIYRPYIKESVISFEYQVPTVEEIAGRIKATLEKHPWLVFEEQGVIQGYAYSGPFRSRQAYSWSVESTVYVGQDFHSRGIGKALYTQLLSLLQKQGALNVIAGVTLPNEKSVRLHESFGFQPVSVYKDVGYKFGRWWDVGYWQLEFDKPEVPLPIRSYNDQ